MYSFPDIADATDARDRAAASLEFHPFPLDHGRDVLWLEVRPHAWAADNTPTAWGVYPVWRYDDSPELGRFGGPFVPIAEVPTWAAIEAERKAIYRADPLFESFVGTALEDLSHGESDEACTDEREPRDTGTIYTLDARTFAALREIVSRFRADCAEHIAAALELEPGADGFRWRNNRGPLSDESLGSTLWLAVIGSGVTFTDDGDADCLEAMAEWANSQRLERLYFGDAGNIHLA